MSIWIVAVFLSGLSYYTKSFAFLVFARMLSGVGEASIQCSIPPWITNNAPKESKGSWLALFYTGIPVGTALGYSYSSIVATTLGWQYAFFFEGFIMIPFVLFLFAISPGFPVDSHPLHELEYSLVDNKEVNNVRGDKFESDLTPDRNHRTPSVFDEFRALLKSSVYVLLTLGYAAQTGALIGVSTFGSSFLMGLGFFDDESKASTTFGAVICIAGIIATPLGGYLVDRRTAYLQKYIIGSTYVEKMKSFSDWRTFSDDHNTSSGSTTIEGMASLVAATEVITISSIFGVVILATVYVIYNLSAYMLIVCFGAGFIFLCTPGINIGIYNFIILNFSFIFINIGVMQSVPTSHRAFAIAVTSVMIHAFGDVPSPIIAGYIKDKLAPGKCSECDEYFYIEVRINFSVYLF